MTGQPLGAAWRSPLLVERAICGDHDRRPAPGGDLGKAFSPAWVTTTSRGGRAAVAGSSSQVA